MKNLLRIPYVRQGLILKILAWMVQGVEALKKHHEVEVCKRDLSAY